MILLRNFPYLITFFGLFVAFAFPATALAQNISATITNANAPSGTLTHPHFIIDSDGSNSDPAYDRDAVAGSVDVEFNWTGGTGSGSDVFRATVRLVGPDEEPVELANGSTVLISANQSISLSSASPTTSRTFSFDLKPGLDLGAGDDYVLRYAVQRRYVRNIDASGNPIYAWTGADGPEDSSSFTVVHFVDDPSEPGARNIVGCLTGDPSWQKIHALQTGTTTLSQSFRVSVPYRHWRYDPDGVTELTELRFTVEMTDDEGISVPLENGGVDTVSFNRAAFIAGNPNRPSTNPGTRFINFAPTEQLDALNRTYAVRVKFEHLETPPSGYRDNGTSDDSASVTLLHFNGNLRFGFDIDENAVDTVFSAYSNNPTADAFYTEFVGTELQVTNGAIPGFDDYSYGSGATLEVGLRSNGDAVVAAGVEPVIVAGGGEVEADFGGVRVIYPGTRLTPSGGQADELVVRLPQGLSYTPNRATAAGRYESDFRVEGLRELNGEFRHHDMLTEPTGADAWVFDESRTLIYEVNGFTLTEQGEIRFNSPQAEWVHAQAWATLEANQDDDLHETPEMDIRLSNEGYLRHANVASSSQVRFGAAADGTARCLHADILAGATVFRTHFPYDAEVAFDSNSMVKIRNGVISDDSALLQVADVELSYEASCPQDACGPEDAEREFVLSFPSGNLALTSDGGLHGGFTTSPVAIDWGLRGDGASAHRTDVFVEGAFLASGNQLYDHAAPLAVGGPLDVGDSGPQMILLAGYDPADHNVPVYPETAGYRDGVGSWPGATFAVASSGQIGASRLADMPSDYLYELQQEVSKYYVRPSGLSGRHVATEKGFNPGAVMYGYEFEITRFQLTFLSNENEKSWLSGGVVVPEPSGFRQRFTDLTLSCTGALETAKIDPDDAGPKPLAYWFGEFVPQAVNFAPEADADCYDPRFLTIGLLSGAANIATPLAGTLGFLPDGNIAQLATNIEGVDSRLGLPATLPMDGPGDEQYLLNPVTKLYFNNPDFPDAPDRGFVSFAATCNVPFFQDLRVHVMTSAQAGVPSPLYIASGWGDGSGESFFNNTKFDVEHRGFPYSISVDDYQNPSSEADFVVNAVQSLFGKIELRYPLKWNPSSRYFQSWRPEEDEIFVIEIEHQVDYLSPANAEITFGAQYPGLPHISLVNSAYDVVDEKLGKASALTRAIGGLVTDALHLGVQETGNLVNDSMEHLLDQAIDQLEEEIIDPLYQAVVDSYGSAVSANQSYNDWVDGGLKAQLDHYFNTSVGAGADTVKGQLQLLANASDNASSVIARIDKALVRGILAIDSVAGQLQTYRDGDDVFVTLQVPDGFTAGDALPGILTREPGPDDSEVRILVKNLIEELIVEFAPPDVAAVINPLLADRTSSINARLNRLMERFDPTFDRIEEVLMQARGYLVTVREKLNDGQDILTAFQQILANANDEIDSVVNSMREVGENFINNVAASAASVASGVPSLDGPLAEVGSIIDDFDKDEFVSLLRAELRDRLLQQEFIQQMQYVLRQYISELDMTMRSAIDAVFAGVSEICKHVIRETIGPIDDTINGLIGLVNKVAGAGSVTGYAHIQGDTLRRIRLGAKLEIKVPDEMQFHGFIEIVAYHSKTTTGSAGVTPCLEEGEKVVEARLGGFDVPLDLMSPGVRAEFRAWFSMKTDPFIAPRGIGGSLVMTGGELEFESMIITDFSASVVLGSRENYIAGTATVIISDYESSGGMFFGKTCSAEPLELVDPNAVSLLGQPPFIGAYVYGEVWLPISELLTTIPESCLFRISAGVEAGAFLFYNGPTYGGRMLLNVSGEALCVVSIGGEVSMVGISSGGDMRFSGRGTISGKAGKCPFCTKISISSKLTYQNNTWTVEQ